MSLSVTEKNDHATFFRNGPRTCSCIKKNQMNFVEYGFNFTCEEKTFIFHSWLRAVQPQNIEISDLGSRGIVLSV